MADKDLLGISLQSSDLSEDVKQDTHGSVTDDTDALAQVPTRKPVPTPRKSKSPAAVDDPKDEISNESHNTLDTGAEPPSKPLVGAPKEHQRPRDLPFDPFSQFVDEMSKQINTNIETKLSPLHQVAFRSPEAQNTSPPTDIHNTGISDTLTQDERPQIAQKPSSLNQTQQPINMENVTTTGWTTTTKQASPISEPNKSPNQDSAESFGRAFSPLNKHPPGPGIVDFQNARSTGIPLAITKVDSDEIVSKATAVDDQNNKDSKSPSLRLPHYLITQPDNTDIKSQVSEPCDITSPKKQDSINTTPLAAIPNSPQHVSSPKEFECTGYDINGACRVILHQTEISKLHVDTVVIYANDRLVHRDGVSKSVAHKGGASLLTACIATINISGTIPVTRFIQTTSGNLPCKQVIHAVIPTKSAPDDQQEQGTYSSQLQQTFYNVLKHIRENDHGSVAITTSGFVTNDHQVVAEAWYNAINKCIQIIRPTGGSLELHVTGTSTEILKLLLHFFRTDRHASILKDVKSTIEQAQHENTADPKESDKPTSNSSMTYENVEMRREDTKMSRTSPGNRDNGHTFGNPEYMEFDPFQKHNTDTTNGLTVGGKQNASDNKPTVKTIHHDENNKPRAISTTPPELPPRPTNQQPLSPTRSSVNSITGGEQSELKFTVASPREAESTPTGVLSPSPVAAVTPNRNMKKVTNSPVSMDKPQMTRTTSLNEVTSKGSTPKTSYVSSQMKSKGLDARPKRSTTKEPQNIYSDISSEDTTYESINAPLRTNSTIDINIPAPRSSVTSFREQQKQSWYNTERRQNIQNIGQESYNPNLPAGFIVGKILQIYVHVHDITKLNLDVVVNPTNKDLSSNNSTSKAIMKCAGAELVEECHQIRKSRDLHETEVIETSGWQLPCRHILHAVIPRWTELGKFRPSQLQLQYHNFLDDIKSTYENILKYVSSIGLKSVVISPLNLGIQSVPVEHISNAICDAIFAMVRSQASDNVGTLEVIHVVDSSPDNLSTFVNRIPKGSRKEVDKIKVTSVSAGAVYNAISLISDVKSNDGDGSTDSKPKHVDMTNTYANSDQTKHVSSVSSPKPNIAESETAKPISTPEMGARPKHLEKAGNQAGRKLDFKARSFHIGKHCNVIMHICDITMMNVDAIVNPTSSQLQSNSGISKSIAKAAGTDMAQYCEEILQNQGLVQVGDVVLTPPGHLPCKVVFHSVAPKWPTSGKMEDQTNCLVKLQSTIEKTLEEADLYGVASVALPPYNSGVPRIPRRFMADTMLKSFLNFTKQGKREGSSVRDIHVVDKSPEVLIFLLEDFEKACKDGSLIIAPANDLTDIKIKESVVMDAESPDYSLPKPRTIPEAQSNSTSVQTAAAAAVQRDSKRLDDWGDRKGDQPTVAWRRSDSSAPTDDDVTKSLPSIVTETTSQTGSFTTRGYSLYDPNQLDGVKVYLHMNMITKISTDIIVNPTDKRLKHHKGLSRLVAEMGGAELKAEGQKLIRHSKIPITGVVVTGSGQLPCKLVLHAVVPKWPSKEDTSVSAYNILTQTCLQDMRITFNNIFVKINEIGSIKSVAIPLLSTGVPMEHIVEITFQALLANCCTKSLEAIHMVHVRPDLLKPLAAKLEKACDLPVRGLLVTRLETDVHQEVQSVVAANTDFTYHDIYSEIPPESQTSKKSIKVKGAKAFGRFVSYLSGNKKPKDSDRPRSERRDSQRRYSVS